MNEKDNNTHHEPIEKEILEFSNNSYWTFFEHAPISLWIEDFSKIKAFFVAKAKECNTSLETYLKNNYHEIHHSVPLIKTKEINYTSVKLYEAKNKEDLLKNITKVYTKESQKGFSKLVFDVLIGKKESSIQTVNKTLQGNKIDVILKFKVLESSKDSLESVIVSVENVTRRIKAEKSLNATKNLFLNTLTSINDGLVILDADLNYEYINEVAAKLIGKESKYLIGKKLWEEFPAEKGDIFCDKYNEAIKTRKPISFENYFKPWNKWFENRIIPSNEGVLLFFQEITLKKKRENKIKEAYNIINKSSSVAILCKNEWDFPIEFVSENSVNLFGYTHHEFLKNDLKIYDIVHVKYLPYLKEVFNELSKTKPSKGVILKSVRIRTKNNNLKWVQANIDLIKDSEGKITHIQGILTDVSERKKAEDLLFRSNQRLKDQFNNTPLASIVWDINFKVVDWNNSAQRIFGYSAEEAIGKHANDLIIRKNLKKGIRQQFKELLKQDGGYTFSNQNVNKNGDIIICDWYNVALKDTKGNVVGVASLADDITEKTIAKDALQKSEAKYRDLFEKSHDPVFIISKQGKYLDCNEATLKLFACNNKNDIIGESSFNFSPELQPNGENTKDVLSKARKKVIEKGSYKFKVYKKDKKGRVFPTEIILTKIIDNDNTVKIYGIYRDITQKIKQQTIEKVLFNISKAAASSIDLIEFSKFVRKELNNIIDTSNFYIAIYNKEKNTITLPYVVDEFNPLKEFSAKKTLTRHVIKTEKSLMLNNSDYNKLIEEGIIELVGTEPETWIGVPLKIKEDVFGVIGVQSYTNKITYNKNDLKLLKFVANHISNTVQRKQKDDELKKALEKAQESDRLKSAFLANMSHEIRTPMNGIIGFSELFLNSNTSDQSKKQYAKIVINNSKQLLSIVNDVLDFSKIEAGVVKLNYESVNINKLLDSCYEFFKQGLNETKINLTFSKGLDNFKSNINIDKTKLNQILNNLLSNAFKFTLSGEISFGYVLKNEYLEFFVKDSGVGIDKSDQEKIFDRFTQAKRNLKKKNKGTGLGLAICKNYVELFKGDIWLKSNKKGTTVFFTIPYIKPKPKGVQSTFMNTKIQVPELSDDITILVAEDEEYNMLYINELFSAKNIKMIEAENGQQAVAKFAENPQINLILMDIKMPVMDGIEAMKKIKEKNKEIPIIALSAFAMECDQKKALESGFDEYLSKPIDKKKLFELIKKYTKK